MKPSKELAALRKDRARLDFLDGMGTYPMDWYARRSSTGRGFRLHQSPVAMPETLGHGPNVRAAIDSAMRQSRGAK